VCALDLDTLQALLRRVPARSHLRSRISRERVDCVCVCGVCVCVCGVGVCRGGVWDVCVCGVCVCVCVWCVCVCVWGCVCGERVYREVCSVLGVGDVGLKAKVERDWCRSTKCMVYGCMDE
jgi:hypothetical protein